MNSSANPSGTGQHESRRVRLQASLEATHAAKQPLLHTCEHQSKTPKPSKQAIYFANIDSVQILQSSLTSTAIVSKLGIPNLQDSQVPENPHIFRMFSWGLKFDVAIAKVFSKNNLGLEKLPDCLLFALLSKNARLSPGSHTMLRAPGP